MHILILHGIEGHAGIHWQGWLKKELEKKNHTVHMPELPESMHPNRFDWLHKIIQETQDISPSELIIVAHSLSVASALDYIEQTDAKVRALVSVSGFCEDYGAELNSYFMKEKDIQFSEVNKHLAKAYVLFGDNDPYVPQVTLTSLAQRLGVHPEIIKEGGHLNSDSGFSTFPRLLEIIEEITLCPQSVSRSK